MTTVVPYLWIWPGRPGGYVPVIADEFLNDPRLKQREAAKNKGKTGTDVLSNRSIPGISAKADASIERYRKNALAIEKKKAKPKAAKQAKKQAKKHRAKPQKKD